ncbi:Nicotinamidase-related amidase [Sphingomonas sp. NFR04]|uniref:cysteine hydrolase family protein n=1 Tax=Sphingomonas sp. NFR04 TaxID=1566283 RepID=UPI0008E720DA|nr:cysteine hydrolase family protein [Sphingomonas sp. NFR04]SFK25470.1 Nicotinamidase-related amidase [Sphingomonas sp. NFR04]
MDRPVTLPTVSHANDKALVLIDLQRAMSDPALPPRNNPQAEANAARLLAAWRRGGGPIVHVRHLSLDPASGFRPGQPGAEFQPAFLPMGREHVVDKHVTDAFAGSGLERYLHLRSITGLVFAGVATNYSVEATARSAGCLGFRATVVSDACFTFARHDLAGALRSAEDIHLASLSNLDGEYAAIRSTDSVLSGVSETVPA